MTPELRLQQRQDDRATRRILIVATTIGFLALIAAGIAAWSITIRNQRFSELVDHTYQVREAINQFQVAMEQSETARRGFILTHQPVFDKGYVDNAAKLEPGLAKIERLTGDNPRQSHNIAKLRAQFDPMRIARDQSMERLRAGNTRNIFNELETNVPVLRMRAMRERLRAMLAIETELLRARSNEQQYSAQTFLVILAAAGVLVVLVALASLLTVLRYTRDLGKSSDALRELNETLEDQVSERTSDLSRANDEIQRFAYIVSHDLRSPLVNVMGFTAELDASTQPLRELVDRAEAEAPTILTPEATDAARTDLPEAIRFIRTSTEKMDRLINAILKLSREGRRVITPEPVSVERVVGGIRETLAHRLDEKGAEIVVPSALPGVFNDRLALEQVFGNVIENAVKYLDPARPGRIEVRGRVEGQRAVFEVADNGRGIAAHDHARIFDLFRRAGQQDQPGEGIGLAHVRALTYRLGGTIDVSSELGVGSTFRISLPLRYSEQSGTEG